MGNKREGKVWNSKVKVEIRNFEKMKDSYSQDSDEEGKKLKIQWKRVGVRRMSKTRKGRGVNVLVLLFGPAIFWVE